MKNVIFDLGAVMFDWSPQKISESFTADMDLQNLIQKELFYHNNWIEFDCGLVSETELMLRTKNQLSLSQVEVENLFEEIRSSLKLIPKTLEVLKYVKQKQLRAYCLSNISPEFFQHLSSLHDLFQLFDGIVISGDENTGKPGQEIFEIILSRYQLKAEETLFIDDSHANTETAANLGIKTVTFAGNKHCYSTIYEYISP